MNTAQVTASSRRKRLHVALAQIGAGFAGACYLPYSAGLLEAYVLAHAPDPARYAFQTPVYRRRGWREAAARMARAHVAGFSLSVWNHNVSLAMAREIKRLNPDCFVVCGGPQTPDRAGEWLAAHPEVDAACHGEGEQTFLELLEALPGDAPKTVAGLSFLSGGRLVVTPPRKRLAELGDIPSPYLTGALDSLLDSPADHEWLGLWETNRGCPYTCAYCDWGSANASKVRLFPMDRLRAEAEWFGERKIPFVFCCDGNFGLFPRDEEIAAMVAETKARHGYPQALSVQNAKNAAGRCLRIQRVLSGAGLNKGVTLALQSVNPTALVNVGRRNIPHAAFKELQARFSAEGVDTYTDLILGLPGETYASFAEGVSRIIAEGQHNRIQFINLSILPNARMADPEYQTRHGMETVVSKVINIHGALEAEPGDVAETQLLVVGTTAMPPGDWIRTRAFSWMIALLYFDKLLQIPLALLHRHAGLPPHLAAEAFLDADPSRFARLAAIAAFFRDQAEAVARGGEEYHGDPDCLGIFWPHDEYAFIGLARDGALDVFYRESSVLLRELADSRGLGPLPWLGDALALNRALLKTPFAEGDITLALDWDVPKAYRAILAGAGDGHIPPGPVRCVVERGAESWSSWEQWMREVVWWGNKKGAYLYRARPMESETP